MRFLFALAAGLIAGFALAAETPQVIKRLGSDRLRQANRIEAITYSPDGERIANGDGDAIHVWDASDGRRLHRIPTGGSDVLALRIAPDGRKLYAAIFSGKETRLLGVDPAAAKVRSNVLVHAGKLEGDFSPDGAWLVMRSEDGKHLLSLSTASSKLAWQVPYPEGRFHSFAFHPDNKVVAVGTLEGWVHVYNAATAEVVHQYSLGDNAVWHLAYSPDGADLVAALSSPGEHHIRRFDAATGKERWSYRTTRARQLTFTRDGSDILYYGVRDDSYSEDDQWHRIDARTGKRTGKALDSGYGNSVAFRPDGKVLAVGGFHGHISLWDLATRKRLEGASADPPGLVTDLRFGKDGTTLRGWSRGWYEWNVQAGKQTRLTGDLSVGESEQIAVSHDQRWLVRNDPDISSGIADPPWRVELVDLARGRRRDLDGLTRDDEPRLRFLPDGRLLSIGKTGLRIYDPATARSVVAIGTDDDHEVAVSDDGALAIITTPAGDGLQAVRWDLTTGRRTGEFTCKRDEWPRIGRASRRHGQISPDGNLLAISSIHAGAPDFNEHHTSLFDSRTGRYRGGWEDISLPFELVFSPDSRSAAVHFGSILGIEIRETSTGALRRRFSGGPTVSGCRFSPDGRMLAVAWAPGPIELWDLIGDRTGQVGKRNSRPAADLWGALASSDGEEAYAAVCFLRANAAEAIPFLNARLPIPAAKDPAWVAARISDLDATTFRDRERATTELAAAGEVIAPELRAALPRASAEARERLNGLLAKSEVITTDRLRAIRACEVLEGIGSAEARSLLEQWAKGTSAATLTREATESLARLKRR